MLSIIVVQNGASKAALERTLSAAESSGLKDITVLAQSGQLTETAGARIMDSGTNSLNSVITSIITSSKSSHVVILDGRLAPTNSQLQAALGAITRSRNAEMISVPLRSGQQNISMPKLSVDQLSRWISSSPELPFMCIALNRAAMVDHMPLNGESLFECMAQLTVKIISDGQSVVSADSSLALPIDLGSNNSLRMSSDAMARVLKFAVEINNIEDLYPQHAWEAYEQESAAAAYHDLAAMFVKLGDLDHAQECLRLSDSFEDSPRSLALKAIIARLRGETLGAVANMVASLQQYEIRKSNDGSHYLSFSPMNVEMISSDMQAGLAALNKSDNETALQHFSKAVISFDPFFADSGLLR